MYEKLIIGLCDEALALFALCPPGLKGRVRGGLYRTLRLLIATKKLKKRCEEGQEGQEG